MIKICIYSYNLKNTQKYQKLQLDLMKLAIFIKNQITRNFSNHNRPRPRPRPRPSMLRMKT